MLPNLFQLFLILFLDRYYYFLFVSFFEMFIQSLLLSDHIENSLRFFFLYNKFLVIFLHLFQIFLNLQFFLLNRVQSLFFFLQSSLLFTYLSLFSFFVLEVLVLDVSHHFLILDLSHELSVLIRAEHLLAIIFQLTFLTFLPRV